MYKWLRKNSNYLNNQGVAGPNGDFNGDMTRKFLIASDALAGNESISEAMATFTSPEFKTDQHPYECFNFWFYFGVSQQN